MYHYVDSFPHVYDFRGYAGYYGRGLYAHGYYGYPYAARGYYRGYGSKFVWIERVKVLRKYAK